MCTGATAPRCKGPRLSAFRAILAAVSSVCTMIPRLVSWYVKHSHDRAWLVSPLPNPRHALPSNPGGMTLPLGVSCAVVSRAPVPAPGPVC